MTQNRIIIFDTTLRDGEQSPGASMSLEEKLAIAQVLEEMGVDVIEAGFPVASPGDFQAVKTIAGTIKDSSVAGLARAAKRDIETAWEALASAPRPRIHTFLSTSPLHMKHKLQKEPEEVVAMIRDSVGFARSLCPDVEWSAEDGSRTEPDFLCRCVETAIAAGATTINIPDTVGYAIPQEFAGRINDLFERVPNIDKAVISVHCHNDLGLAVANSLAALSEGARQVECTVNGLGERAGNAAMEEIIMALRTRRDLFGLETKIKTELITRASRLVSAVTGFVIQPNKAVVGANAFAHESGIHQDGMLKHAATYEIMTPESVGLSRSNLVMGKHSGRHAFREKLRALGYALEGEALDDAFARFKALADRKKEIFDEDLAALVDDQIAGAHDAIRFVSLRVHCGSEGPQQAELTLSFNGEARQAQAQGQGPVDAAFKAIRALVPHEAELKLYQVSAVTQGTDAQAEVSVRLAEGDRIAHGQSADIDTIVASVKAYVVALNKLSADRNKADGGV